mgnify:FL=1
MKKKLEDLNCVIVDVREEGTNHILQFRRKFMWDQVRYLSLGDAKFLVRRELGELNLGETLSDALNHLCDGSSDRKGFFRKKENTNLLTLKLRIRELFKEI